MNSFGFPSQPTENPLLQYLKQYTPSQPTEPVSTPEPRRNGGIAAYEINAKSDIEYIEPDTSGRRQIYLCDGENKIYTGRYNHARKEMDYRVYVDEGEMNLFQKSDNAVEMAQIAEALVAVANKLESMHSEIQELKKGEPPKEDSGRRPNGQFKKKGE